MKRILAALFCIAFFQTGFSQTGIVKGTVSDATSKETLIGAYVFNLNDKANGTSTDIDGNFSFKAAVGSFQVVVTYTGMVSDTFKINVSEDQPTVLDIKLKPLVEELGEVVVSAGKFTQRIEEITQSIEIIKPSLVENKNTRTISTALEQTPGLTVYDSEPQIRGGSGFTFGVGTRVGIYVDDLPMLLGDAGKPEWGFIPVENLEQVEVVKGASSVLFGSGALSGVINIRTAYPKEKPETKINFYSGFYSSPETETMSGGQKFANFFGMDMQAANGKKWWNGPANFSGINFFHSQRIKQWDLVFGGSFQYDHNYIGPWDITGKYVFAGGDVPDTLTNSDVADKKGRLNFKIRRRSKKKEGLAYGINGNFMRSHTNFSLVWNNDTSGLFRSYPGTMTLQEIFTFYVDPFVSYVKSNGTKHYLRTRLYYADNQNSNNQSNRSLVTYGEYQFQRNFLFVEDLNMTAGVMAQHTNSVSNLYIGDGDGSNGATNAAVYTQLDKKFWKAFNLSLGLRYEFFQINNLEVVTKPVIRSGLSIKLAKATYLRASYGQGYRFPTIAERFIVTSAGGLKIYPNPNLQPETSWNGEIGIKQGMKIGKFYGYLDIVGFWQEYSNTMEYVMGNWGKVDQTGSDIIGFKFLNTGDTRIRGLEISLAGKGQFTKDFSMTILTGYTLIDPKILNPTKVFAYDSIQQIGADTSLVVTPLSYQSTSSDKSGVLKYRSRHQFKGDVEFTYKNFSIGYSARYYSHIDNIDQAFFGLDKVELFPGYSINGTLPSGITEYRANNTKGNWVMDARVSYQITKKSKLAFIVSNVANKLYSLRPLKMEAPRSASIQYTLSL
jgi:iron complex outermembrane receptor protein